MVRLDEEEMIGLMGWRLRRRKRGTGVKQRAQAVEVLTCLSYVASENVENTIRPFMLYAWPRVLFAVSIASLVSLQQA